MSGAFTPLLPCGQALSDCNYPKRILIAGVKSPYIEYACISLLACGGQTLKGFFTCIGDRPAQTRGGCDTSWTQGWDLIVDTGDTY